MLHVVWTLTWEVGDLQTHSLKVLNLELALKSKLEALKFELGHLLFKELLFEEFEIWSPLYFIKQFQLPSFLCLAWFWLECVV
jgi:hypothetical protein